MRVWAVSLSTMELSPHGLTSSRPFWYSEFGRTTRSESKIALPVALPPESFCEELALKLFRGEPAIPRLG